MAGGIGQGSGGLLGQSPQMQAQQTAGLISAYPNSGLARFTGGQMPAKPTATGQMEQRGYQVVPPTRSQAQAYTPQPLGEPATYSNLGVGPLPALMRRMVTEAGADIPQYGPLTGPGGQMGGK